MRAVNTSPTGVIWSRARSVRMFHNDPTEFFALLTEGFPRLVTISEAHLLDESEGDGDALPFAVRARVRLSDDVALIPDIDVIERSVREALAA